MKVVKIAYRLTKTGWHWRISEWGSNETEKRFELTRDGGFDNDKVVKFVSKSNFMKVGNLVNKDKKFVGYYIYCYKSDWEKGIKLIEMKL